MDLDWDARGGEFPVLLLDHLGVHLLILVKQLVQVDIGVSVLELLFLFTIPLLLLVNLDKGLLYEFYIRLDEFDHMFESLISNLMDLRFSVGGAGAEWVVSLETFDNGQASMVLVVNKCFLELLSPGIRS